MKAADALALAYSSIDASGVAAAGASLGVPLLLSDIPGFRSIWGQTRPSSRLRLTNVLGQGRWTPL